MPENESEESKREANRRNAGRHVRRERREKGLIK